MTLSFIEAGAAGAARGADWILLAQAVDASAAAKVWQFVLSGGFFMVFIGLCSVIAVSVVIHRAISLRRRNVIPVALEGELLELEHRLKEGEMTEVARMVAGGRSTLARVSRLALSEDHETREEAAASTEAGAREEVVRLHSGIAVLEVVITIAPLLGLLGTVSGLVRVFGTLGGSAGELTDPAQVARGIAEALNTTIAGLAVAVPTVVAHSYLTKKIERFAVRMEVLMNMVLAVVYRSGKKSGPTGADTGPVRGRARRADAPPAQPS